VGAARVRDLFQEVRQHAPAIIFIDEIDSIGRARFDRRVVVNLPDKSGCEAIFKVHTPGAAPRGRRPDGNRADDAGRFRCGHPKPCERSSASGCASRTGRGPQGLHRRVGKIVLGPERPIILSEAEKECVAYHEGGHAILGLVVPGADPVHRVTIVPRGQALGVTYQRPLTDRYKYPEAYLRAKIIGMLGGRAAEEVVYGSRTTGAENDIEQATGLARRW